MMEFELPTFLFREEKVHDHESQIIPLLRNFGLRHFSGEHNVCNWV